MPNPKVYEYRITRPSRYPEGSDPTDRQGYYIAVRAPDGPESILGRRNIRNDQETRAAALAIAEARFPNEPLDIQPWKVAHGRYALAMITSPTDKATPTDLQPSSAAATLRPA